MLSRKQAVHFRSTPATSAEHVAGARLNIGKRQILFRAREPAQSFYEVTSGAFMVYCLLADGRRQIVDLVLPGSLCGFCREGTHECSSEALLASTAIAYDRAALHAQDEIGDRLAQKMEQKICDLAEHVVMLGRRTTEERLAAFLVRCAEVWRSTADDSGILFHIPMTRVEIGDYLGMSLETVSRGIADFERRGLIKTGGRQGEMRVFDVAALSGAWRTQRARRRHPT